MPEKLPLLLIPGLLCDETLWAHQRRYLSDIASITVVVTTEDETLAAMVDRALASAPPRFALAGL